MSALWGHVKDGMVRAFQATCVECGWRGEAHFDLDSEAVELAARDSHAHNVERHERTVAA